MPSNREVLPAVLTLLAVIVVQWFVANIAVSLDSSAHIPQSQKVTYGFRTAVFVDILDYEAAVIVTIGMLIIPCLVAAEYLGSTLTRRTRRLKARATESFPYAQLLRATWVWLVYWPLWILLFATAPSWFVVIGGACVVPPLLALAIGFRVALRSGKPQLLE